MKQPFSALWEKRGRLFIAAVAMALVFAVGMSVQASREAARRETRFQDDLQNFGSQVRLLSADVDNLRRQAGESPGDPMERYVIQNDLAVIRRNAASFPDMAHLPQFSQYPNARLYLTHLEFALLGGSCADVEDLSRVVTICQPLLDARPGGPLEETMAILEENILSGDYQDALDLLGIDDPISITTQGGT